MMIIQIISLTQRHPWRQYKSIQIIQKIFLSDIKCLVEISTKRQLAF